MWPVIFGTAAVILFLGGILVLFKWHNWGPALIMIVISIILGAGVGIHHHFEQPSQKPKTERVANNANQKANRAQKNANKAGQNGKKGLNNVKQNTKKKVRSKKNNAKTAQAGHFLRHIFHHPSDIIVVIFIGLMAWGLLDSTSSGGN